MKYILNKCFGGFSVNESVLKELGYKHVYDVRRDDKRLIKIIEERGSKNVQGMSAMLKVVDIPAEATDWTMVDYDGIERIIYVINGKLNYL